MFTKSIAAVIAVGLGLLGVGTVAVTPMTFGIDWFEPAEKRLEARILSQIRATGVYDDPGRRFVIEAGSVDAGELRDVTIRFRSDASRRATAGQATLEVQPDECQVRLAARRVTFQDTDAAHYYESLEWTLDADGGWPFAAW